MPRELVTIECTEARKEGKPPSRYITTRNKKTQTEKVELAPPDFDRLDAGYEEVLSMLTQMASHPEQWTIRP